MIQAFCEWLSNTPASMAIQNAFWVIPTVQTVHIASIAVVMSSILMVDLRLLGVAGRGQSLDAVVGRYVPWVWVAVIVLLFSGIVLIVGEPGRELLSDVFWLKMMLLVCALLLTLGIQRSMRGGGGFWERRRVVAALVALVSLAVWTAILAAGRWIAYVEHG